MGIRNYRSTGISGVMRSAHNPAWGFVTGKLVKISITAFVPHNPAWGFVTEFVALPVFSVLGS